MRLFILGATSRTGGPLVDQSIKRGHEVTALARSFNVYTTDLGEEGIDLSKVYDYDIILLDLTLPDMSGLNS